MYIDIDSTIKSILMFLVFAYGTILLWTFIAHVSMYSELKSNHVKQDEIEDFTFLRYTASEIKRKFTGKGLF